VKNISWQLIVIIAIIALCITGLEIYALSQGVDGVLLTVVVGGLIGIPGVIITRKISKPKVK